MHKTNKLVIASNNPGKVREIIELLSPYNIETISLIDQNIEEPEETGLTFADNAKLKAEYYGKLFNLPALADDSGICIEALGGYPGVISARIAGPNKDFYSAFNLIEQKLLDKNLKSSPAHFISSLSIWYPNGDIFDFEGRIDGEISFPARGNNNQFGYNPIFVPNGYDKTFSEMSLDEKNHISHRKLAFDKFIKHLVSINEI